MRMFIENDVDALNQEIIDYLHSLDNIITFDIESIAESVSKFYRSELIAISARSQALFENNTFHSIEEFQSYYPELNRIIRTRRRNIFSLLKSVVKKYIQDRPYLERAGFPAGSYIKGFVISDGDSHRMGQRVCFIKNNLGELVYKPRSMAIDCVVFNLASIVNKKAVQSISIDIPKSVNYGSYGWQEFIEYSPAEDQNELSKYYQSLGSLTAFFVGLGGHDMHYENLTISHGKAIPLDLETAFGTRRQAQRLGELSGLLAMTNLSASLAGAGTLILPPLLHGERFDIDISPITDGIPQRSKTIKGLSVKESNDNIDVSMQNAVVTKVTPYIGPLGLDDIHPRWYVDIFHQGYKEMIALLISCTEELVDFLNKEIPNISNRCVIRPTATYAAFLDTSYHPKYLVSKQERDKLFMRLGPPPGVPVEIGEQALLAERKALLEGDIPYFTDDILDMYMRESQLKEESKIKEIEGFSVDPQTPLCRLGKVQDDAIRYLHYGAFAGLDAEVWKTRGDDEIVPFFNIELGVSWKDALCNLKNQAQNLVIYDTQSNSATMFMQTVGADNRVQTVPLNGTYYEGQGILLLLAEELWSKNEIPPEIDIVKALLVGLLEPLEHISGEPVSGFIGGFSRLRLLSLVRQYMGDKSADNLEDKIIEHASQEIGKLGKTITGDDPKIDYVTGLAGALAVLGTLGSSLSDSGIFLRDHLHSIVAGCLVEDKLQDISGIAHGPLGLMIGLVLGGKPLDPHEAQDIRIRMRRQVEAELANAKKEPPAIRQAWCSGIPGIAEAFARVLESTGGLEDWDRKLIFELFVQLKLDVASLNGPVDISLCHGIAGAFSAWCRISHYISEPQILEDLKEEVTRFRQRLHDGELEIRGGTRHATSSLCTMLGMSGAIFAFAHIEDGQDFQDFNIPFVL